RGVALRRFAIYEAIREQQREKTRAWRRWPMALHDPNSAAVQSFARRHLDRVEFHEYLQWQADRQLAACAVRAHASGMEIGLYRDLAVGVDPGGADSWLMGGLSVP